MLFIIFGTPSVVWYWINDENDHWSSSSCSSRIEENKIISYSLFTCKQRIQEIDWFQISTRCREETIIKWLNSSKYVRLDCERIDCFRKQRISIQKEKVITCLINVVLDINFVQIMCKHWFHHHAFLYSMCMHRTLDMVFSRYF